MATSFTLQNDPALPQGYLKVDGSTSATFTTSGITGNLTGNVTGNVTGTATNAASGSQLALKSAKAWVNFDGTLSTPITPRASFNVSSVTKNGTGEYTVNFATPMADANYAMSLGGHGDTNSTMGYVTGYRSSIGGYTPTTTSIRLQSCNGANAKYDIPCVCVAIFGN